MQPLVIIGAGGHGREVLDIVDAVNQEEPRYEFIGFLDDTGGDPDILSRRQARVLGGTSTIKIMGKVLYVIGIGAASARRHFDRLATSCGWIAPTLVHPAATVGSNVTLAPGCVLAAGSRVTTNVRLGRHTHLNVNSSVSHDCSLGDYVTLSPGSHASGWTTIADGVTLGTGAVTRDRVALGEGCLVGAGAVVVRDVAPYVIVSGVPARPRGPVPCR